MGPIHKDVAIAMQNLGGALLNDGQLAEAEAWTLRALEMTKRLFGDESAGTAQVLINHGEILTELHRLDEARSQIEQAVAILRKQKASAYFIAYGLRDLGRVQLAAGDPRTARATLLAAGRTLDNAQPLLSAEIDFAIGQASWAVPVDRGGALRLVRQARATIAATKGQTRKVAEIDDWLVAHGAGSRRRSRTFSSRPSPIRSRRELETSAVGGPGHGRCRRGRLLRLQGPRLHLRSGCRV